MNIAVVRYDDESEKQNMQNMQNVQNQIMRSHPSDLLPPAAGAVARTLSTWHRRRYYYHGAYAAPPPPTASGWCCWPETDDVDDEDDEAASEVVPDEGPAEATAFFAPPLFLTTAPTALYFRCFFPDFKSKKGRPTVTETPSPYFK